MKKSITLLRTLFFVLFLLVVNGVLYGQASLPVNATFSSVTTSGPGTMPTGFTQSGLGGYAGALKFDTQGDYLILWFAGTPGVLTFDVGVNITFPGSIPSGATFTLQQSNDGTIYTDVANYTNCSGGTKTISNLNATTRYVKWIYSTKRSGTNIALKNISLAAASSSTGIISLSPASLSGFTYVEGSGPSSEQTFTLSGSNLTADVSLTASTDFEISKTSGSGYASPLVFTPSNGTLDATTIYVRLKSGLSVGSYSNEAITASSTGADNQTITCSGSVTSPVKPEPSAYPTSFTATANSSSQITITWTDATGGQVPDGYLVKASTGTPTAPVDGTAESNGALVLNVAQGTQQAVFSGLAASTTYNVSIWPYTNSGTAINYKTDGTEPTATATTNASASYTWNQTGSADFGTASNWTPARSNPDPTDVLVFNNGAVTTVTGVSSQTIGGLLVSNGSKVTFSSSAPATLTINNGISGFDLTVDNGCELNIAQTSANAFTIAIASGATGSISGSMDFSSTTANTVNQITAADASGLIFNAGALFTQNLNSTGNVFGSGTANSVVFANGSSFVQYAGSNPFQKTAPSSVVVFQTGSLFKLKGSLSPSFSGRTYANVEIDATGSLISPTGTSAVVMDNLTITNGTLNFNVTGAPGHIIKGNIFVAPGATLNFAPTSAGTVNLGGSALQTISGGGIITTATNSTLNISNNAGVMIDNNAVIGGNLTIASGASCSLNPARQLTVSGTLTNNGTLNLLSDGTYGTATITGTVNGSGTTNVTQVLGADRNWYLSSPVSNAAIPDADQVWYYDETVVSANANDSWKSPTGLLQVGRGYIVNPKADAIDHIIFSGLLNSGDQPAITLTRTSTKTNYVGFNLLGNPYASFLNVNALMNDPDNTGSVLPTIWYRTKNGSAWSFPTFNASSGIGVPADNLGFIPPMQAFWVRATTDGVSFHFKEAFRIHNTTNSPIAFKSSPAPFNKVLRLQVAAGDNTDQAVIYFNPGASNGLDDYDSPKMLNGSTSTLPDLYTSEGNEPLIINGMDTIPYDTEIPLTLNANAAPTSTFTISALEFSNFDPNTHAYLIDHDTNSKTDLTTDTYTFTSDGTMSSRFSVLFTSSNPATKIGTTTSGVLQVYTTNDHAIVVSCNVNGSGAQRVNVYNSMGELIYSKTFTGSQLITPAMNEGMYVVEWMNQTGRQIRKVMVH
ncbi:MAG: fibronectin type III domain-containing protein [Microbacter sp.]